MHQLVQNYIVGKVTDAKGEEKTAHFHKPQADLVRVIADAFGGRLFRMGGNLVLEGDDHQIRILDDEPSLSSAIREVADFSWQTGRDAHGRNFVTLAEILRALRNTVREVDDISTVPIWPVPERVYITGRWKLDGEGDGQALDRMVAFFCPRTDIDGILIRALIVTYFWGGPPGGRPFFVVIGGQETGKTTLIETTADLAGGCFEVQVGDRFDDPIHKQVLSERALRFHVVRLDNLTGYVKSADLAKLITTREIDGRASHLKQGRRSNYITWTATTTEPTFDADLASRTMPILIANPTGGGDWGERVRAFIGENRQAIMGDCLAVLRREKLGTVGRHSRFPEWDDGVLARVTDRPDEVLRRREERSSEVNEDLEAIGRFEERLRGQIDYDSEIDTETLTFIWNEANGTRIDVGWAMRRLRAAVARGALTIPLRPRWPKKHGSVWVYGDLGKQGNHGEA